MIKAASTYVWVRQRLHLGLLESLSRAGMDAVEVFAYRGHFDYHDNAQVRDLGQWFKSNSLKFHSLHSPMFYDHDEWGRGQMDAINLAETDRKRRVAAMDEIKRALEVAEHAPFKFLVQHLGNGGEDFDEHKFDAAMTSVEHLRAFAKPLGVTLLLENIPNELSTPERLMELVTTAHFDDVGFCFDTGHALLMSNIAQAFDLMKPNIRSTHVHDNKGDKDSHLWPGEGNTDWHECAALLLSAPHRPPVLLEIEGEGQANIQQKISESFDVIERRKKAVMAE
jgi:sugar phosphate isomerase/epimerase